jgi:outer membrane lipoprotein SlyB
MRLEVNIKSGTYTKMVPLLILISCASKPVLYPNEKFESVGEVNAQEDTEICMKKADKFLKSPKAKKMLKSGGAGALLGGVVGGVAGIFTGNIAGSAAQGAAMGGAGGAVAGALSPDELKQKYVNQCLSKKGYQVLGWE